MRWEIDDEKVCWAATIMILALLAVILCSCKTHRESTVDYTVASSETYQERRVEEHEQQVAIRMTASRDTVREMLSRSGQIEIERDTAGRTVRVIFEQQVNGLHTQGSSRIDTVYQREVIMIRDSVGSGNTDATIEGRAREKKDVGLGTWGLIGFGGICLLACIGMIVLFILINKRLNQWKR